MLDEEKSTPDHKVYKRGIIFELLKQMLSPDVVDGDEAYEFTWVGKVKMIYIVILTPILMSILSSENAQRFNQSKTYFTLDLLIGWHSTLLRVSRP